MRIKKYENKKALTTSIDLSFLLPLFKNNKKGSSSTYELLPFIYRNTGKTF
jgi:hypothetical protein